MKKRNLENGAINGSIIAIVALVILVMLFGGFSVWAYLNYADQKRDVDGRVSEAVAKAVRDQATKDEEIFAQRDKEPKRIFSGPSDYGKLTFEYPKTWSAHQATDISKGGGVTYEAYLHPVVIPPIKTSKIALNIFIEQKTYDESVAEYENLIKKGDLKSSVYSDGKRTGTRLEGNFDKDTWGIAVLLKMRDRTLTLRTDGDTFRQDFDEILKTVKFND